MLANKINLIPTKDSIIYISFKHFRSALLLLNLKKFIRYLNKILYSFDDTSGIIYLKLLIKRVKGF